MDRRAFMVSAGAAALASSLPAVAFAADSEDAKLRALFDRIFDARIDESPEMASGLGLDTGKRAALKRQLDDYSAKGKADDLARAKREIAQLATIDRSKLSTASALDLEVVEYGLKNAVADNERFTYGSAGGRFAPYVLTQLTGPYQDIPDFLDTRHKIKDAADADAYLSRLSAFATVLDQSLARQKEDAARGVFAPDYILDTTLTQLKALRDQPAASTVLVTSLARKAGEAKLSADYVAKAEAIVGKEVFAALDRQIAEVQALRAKAVHDAGVWRLPDGEAYYNGSIRAATTTSMTGDDIHKLGLEQVAEISDRLDKILKAQGYSEGTPGARLAALNRDPKQLFANTDPGREEMLTYIRGEVKRMEARLPELFATLPKAALEVKRVPVFIQAGSAGAYYEAASMDGTRKAAYMINQRDTFDRPKYGLPTLSYHEGVPGHHLQVSLSQESGSIPMIRRRGGFSAYSEGWALYSEQLADEIGMYKDDPLGQAGYLQSLLFRATRLVVDSGMHAKRWSREKATDYFIATTGIARGRSQGEIDRYTVWPGQATSYKVGHTVWARLRDDAKTKLGAKFDIRQFHEVLTKGAMPLDVLERVVNDWVALQLKT
ncbi:DUF885 domain-containing protein [Sphingoaurantiacus capsulatus]|uniref:DUF885 domain-containing protein n=1 Tax=Sphingoaurantiacus capsulatus TaxID=1771310 RepID=A0ABV7X5W1_9SPHN